MSTSGWEQLIFIVVATAVLAPLLGRYLAATFRGGRAPGDKIFLPIERLVYKTAGVDPETAADPPRLRALDTRLPTHIGAATTAKDVASLDHLPFVSDR